MSCPAMQSVRMRQLAAVHDCIRAGCPIVQHGVWVNRPLPISREPALSLVCTGTPNMRSQLVAHQHRIARRATQGMHAGAVPCSSRSLPPGGAHGAWLPARQGHLGKLPPGPAWRVHAPSRVLLATLALIPVGSPAYPAAGAGRTPCTWPLRRTCAAANLMRCFLRGFFRSFRLLGTQPGTRGRGGRSQGATGGLLWWGGQGTLWAHALPRARVAAAVPQLPGLALPLGPGHVATPDCGLGQHAG
jgi:hypothetical protein